MNFPNSAFDTFILLMDRFAYIPYKLADIALSEGWTRQLAFYCQFITLNGRKVIYNYSHAKLASRLGISRQTVSRNVKFLIKKGLICLKDGHLQAINKTDLYDWLYTQDGELTGSGKIKVRVYNSLTITEYNICFRRVDQNLKQQDWHIRNRVRDKDILMKVRDNVRLTAKEVAQYNKIMDKKKKVGKNVMITDCKYMSDSFISRLLDVSITTARRMLAYWVRIGLVSTKFIKGKLIEKGVGLVAYNYMVSEGVVKDCYFFKNCIVHADKREMNFGDLLISEMEENIKRKDKPSVNASRLLKSVRLHNEREEIKGSLNVMSIVQ